jgi:hypothetical protein
VFAVTSDEGDVVVVNIAGGGAANSTPSLTRLRPSDTQLGPAKALQAGPTQGHDIVMALDPQGRTLAICGVGQSYVGIFDCASGAEQRQVGCGGGVLSLLLDAQGRGLAGLATDALQAFQVGESRDGTEPLRLAGRPLILEWLHDEASPRPLLVGYGDGHIVALPQQTLGWPFRFGPPSLLHTLPAQPQAIVPSGPLRDRPAVRIDSGTEAGVCIAFLDRSGRFDVVALPIDGAGLPLRNPESSAGPAAPANPDAVPFTPMSVVAQALPRTRLLHVVAVSGEARRIAVRRADRLEIRPLIYRMPPATEPAAMRNSSAVTAPAPVLA